MSANDGIINKGEDTEEVILLQPEEAPQKFRPVRVVISDEAPESGKRLTNVTLLHRRAMRNERETYGYFGFKNGLPFLDCPTWKPWEKTGVFHAVSPIGDGKYMAFTNKFIYIVITRSKPAQTASEADRLANIMGVLAEDIAAPVASETATKPASAMLLLSDKVPTVGTEMENVLRISENTFTVTVTNDLDGTAVSRMVSLTDKLPLTSTITKVEQFGVNAYIVETDGDSEFVVLVEK